MGQVIALGRLPVNQEVLRTARKILKEVEQGRMTSLAYMGTGPQGKSLMGIQGELAEDQDYAIEVARDGFSRLIGKRIEKACEVVNLVPPRLRRKA